MSSSGKKTDRKAAFGFHPLKSVQEEHSTLTTVHKPYPLYPLPLDKGKGRRLERGASAPLKRSLLYPEESQREAEPLLLKIFPLSLRERGIKGVRVLVIGREKPEI